MSGSSTTVSRVGAAGRTGSRLAWLAAAALLALSLFGATGCTTEEALVFLNPERALTPEEQASIERRQIRRAIQSSDCDHNAP